jgi:hypothetical protein
MPIEHRERKAKVSCRGDIRVQQFGVDENGVAWLRLSEGPLGEIGREEDNRTPVDLSKCDGIIFAANNPKSFEVIAAAFSKTAQELREHLGG